MQKLESLTAKQAIIESTILVINPITDRLPFLKHVFSLNWYIFPPNRIVYPLSESEIQHFFNKCMCISSRQHSTIFHRIITRHNQSLAHITSKLSPAAIVICRTECGWPNDWENTSGTLLESTKSLQWERLRNLIIFFCQNSNLFTSISISSSS